MKITDIEIKTYVKPLNPPFLPSWDTKPRTNFSTTLVFVHTDEGFTGIGSGDLMYGFKGHEHLFIGKDPFEIENHNRVIDNIDFHYGRCWPLDLALWDLMGKITGQPVYKLLGGASNKVLAYASCGALVSKDVRAEQAKHLTEQGFKAMKIRFHHPDVREDLAVVEAVREAVGDKLELMVDANQGWRMAHDVETPWDLKKAVQVARELEKLNVYWFEEPLYRADYEGMQRLRDMVDLRIAGGEMNRSQQEFRELALRGCLDVFQPDAATCGGISQCRKTADFVKQLGAVFSPHTWSNGIGLIANAHLCCGIGDVPFLEYPYDPVVWTPDRRDYIQTPETYTMVDQDGYIRLSNRPGLGFELNEDAMAEYEIDYNYTW